MNFEHMPELEWPLGYPFALLLMVAMSALLFVVFKRRGGCSRLTTMSGKPLSRRVTSGKWLTTSAAGGGAGAAGSEGRSTSCGS